MAVFKKYSEIENSYRQKYIDDIIQQGQSGGSWCVTTKIHGSNFSFIFTYENGEVSVNCAKRTSILKEGESFFNYDKLFVKFKEQIRKNSDMMKEYAEINELKMFQVTIFGELFGGTYPHEVVPRLNVGSVQKEVYYSNDIEFLAFDVFILEKSKEDEVVSRWLSPKEYDPLLSTLGWPMIPILFIGSFEDCLKYDNLFEDKIHELYGMPPIENNWCEGVVIKPLMEVKRFTNGDRIIIKNKNDKFSEKKKVKPQKVKVEVSEEDIKQRDIISEYINDNRLRSVISKLGKVENTDFSKLQKLLIEDVREEFFKDYDKNEYGPIFGKWCGKLCAELIRPNFLNIIDGVY